MGDGIAAAFSGQVAVMDVYAAQLLMDGSGVRSIDIVPERRERTNFDFSAWIATCRVATVRRSSARSGTFEGPLQMRKPALIRRRSSHSPHVRDDAQWADGETSARDPSRCGHEARRVHRMIIAEWFIQRSWGRI
jgi:hypothetical protein